jgi:hypothetical protein
MLLDAQNHIEEPLVHEDHNRIQTTLYDLIEAVNETVETNDDRIVTEVVMDLLIAGHTTGDFTDEELQQIRQYG